MTTAIVTRIKVIKYYDSQDWWKDMVGKEFDVVDCFEDSYILKEGMRGILKCVCNPIDWKL